MVKCSGQDRRATSSHQRSALPPVAATVWPKDSSSRGLECSPTGGYWAPSLPIVDPVAAIRGLAGLIELSNGSRES